MLFADDATIYVQGHNIKDIIAILNKELINVSNWITANKLTLNISKTFYMLSSSIHSIQDNIDVQLNNKSLSRVNNIKFLGVTIDENLTWKAHLQQVCIRISQVTGVIYRIRNNVTKDSLKLIYYSTVYPVLLYCSAVWGGAFKTLIDQLFVAQKKVIRVMSYKSKYEHTNPLFCDYKLLKLPDLILLQTCLFVFKALHVYPTNIFQPLSHNINTRRPHDLRVPYCRTVQAQRSVSVRGVTHWNNLPQDIKSLTSINTFKGKIKSSLLQSYEQ